MATKHKKGDVVAFSDKENPEWFDVLKVDGDELTVRQQGEVSGIPYEENTTHVDRVLQVKK